MGQLTREPGPRRRGAHRAPVSGVRAAAGAAVREGLGLVVPLVCAGCGTWDAVLCDACAAMLAGPAFRCESAAPRLDLPGGVLPVWAAAAYTGPVRDAVVAWKDRGRTDVAPWLTAAVRATARAAAPALGAALGGTPVVVVPVPSRPGAQVRRGGDRARVLALACAAGFRSAGLVAAADGVLAVRGVARDQVGLGARARGQNLRSGFRVRRAALTVRAVRAVRAVRSAGSPKPGDDVLRGRWCVIVDDVLTTGSTLAAATRALASAGAVPLAAVVLAATPPPTATDSDNGTDTAIGTDTATATDTTRDLRPLPRVADPG